MENENQVSIDWEKVAKISLQQRDNALSTTANLQIDLTLKDFRIKELEDKILELLEKVKELMGKEDNG